MGIKILLLSLLLVIAFSLTLILLVISLPLRLFVFIIAKLSNSNIRSFCTGVTHLYCFDPIEGKLPPVHLGIFIIFKGNLLLDRVRQLTDQRVIRLVDPRGKLVFKRFQHTWTKFWGYRFWVKEENFDINHHVRMLDYLPEGTIHDEESLQKHMRVVLEQEFDAKKSPWEFLIIHNYILNGEVHSVLIIKWHHVIADGYTMASMYQALFTCSPFAINFPKKSWADRALATCWMALMPYHLAEFLTEDREHSVLWEGDARIWKGCTSGFTQPFHVEKIKRIRKKFGVSYSSVLYASIAGGIFRLAQEARQPIPEYLRVVLPLRKDSRPEIVANYLYHGYFRMPIRSKSREERLMKTDQQLRTLGERTDPKFVDYFISMAGWMPADIRDVICWTCGRDYHMALSNFLPFGSTYFEQHEAVDMIPVMDVTPTNIGLYGLITGLPDRVRFGFSLDKKIIPFPGAELKLKEYIEEELEAFANAGVQ